MARFSISEKFKTIIEGLAIVDFLADQGHEPVRKEGSEEVYLCPFHNDTKPSFKVNPEKRCWNCFGCTAGEGLGKDIIGLAVLVYEIEGVDRSNRRTEACKRLWLDYMNNNEEDEQATAQATPKAQPLRAKKKNKEQSVINPPLGWTFQDI